MLGITKNDGFTHTTASPHFYNESFPGGKAARMSANLLRHVSWNYIDEDTGDKWNILPLPKCFLEDGITPATQHGTWGTLDSHWVTNVNSTQLEQALAPLKITDEKMGYFTNLDLTTRSASIQLPIGLSGTDLAKYSIGLITEVTADGSVTPIPPTTSTDYQLRPDQDVFGVTLTENPTGFYGKGTNIALARLRRHSPDGSAFAVEIPAENSGRLVVPIKNVGGLLKVWLTAKIDGYNNGGSDEMPGIIVQQNVDNSPYSAAYFPQGKVELAGIQCQVGDNLILEKALSSDGSALLSAYHQRGNVVTEFKIGQSNDRIVSAGTDLYIWFRTEPTNTEPNATIAIPTLTLS